MGQRPLWIFGYGSLTWNPGFEVAEAVVARLAGYRRSFCMRSIHHRGTPQVPGLVLALDAEPGAVCDGLALRAAPGSEDATLELVRTRELVTSAYLERWRHLDLADGRQVTAVVYVVDPAHEQYSGGLTLDEQAAIIAGATGGRGANSDYLWNTASHLKEIGIEDSDLTWLAAKVRTMA